MTNRTATASLSLVVAAGLLAAAAPVAGAAPGPGGIVPAGSVGSHPAITRTVVIGLDGTMLDHVLDADTPTLHRLMDQGTSGRASIAGHPTISGPSWSTILTGVWHTKHGVVDNSFTGSHYDRYPTAFTRIEKARPELRTVSIATWGGIATIATSGTPAADRVVTAAPAASEAAQDAATADAAAGEITGGDPDFVFTQLDQVDGAGHSAGTQGAEYRTALERVDAEVGKIVKAVDDRAAARGERWTVLVTADHGHKPTGGHGGQSAEEAATFVIARGAGYRPGATRDDYTIADITPTVLENLGIARSEDLDGVPLAKTATPVTGSLGSLSS